MNKKKKRVVLLIVCILIIAVIVVIFTKFNKKRNIVKDNNGVTEYDLNQLVDGAETVIEDPSGGKIIETSKTVPQSDMKKTDDNTKNKYVISDVEIIKNNAVTTVKGKVKNNSGQKHKIQINAKFYSDGKISTSNYVIIENLKSRENRDFEIELVGDLSETDYKLEVEYTD